MRRVAVVAGFLLWTCVTAGAQTPAFAPVPDNPPRASLISISAPNPAGDVTVTGAAGSVSNGSRLILVTLDTGHFVQATAAGNGSFNATIFAPPGTSIMVKADPTGASLARLRFLPTGQPEDEGELAALPGTIVRVADSASTGGATSFGGAGLTRPVEPPQLPAWTFQGTIASREYQPGGSIRVQGTLRISSTALLTADSVRANTRLSIERLSGADGQGAFGQDVYASMFMTATGLPIERISSSASPAALAKNDVWNLTRTGTQAEAAIDMTLQLPADLPAGYYRPYISFAFDNTVPIESPLSRGIIFSDRPRRRPSIFNQMGLISAYLPIVKVGSPAAPRMYWTLLSDTLSNGTRGTGAIEDRNRFGLASRIVTQSENFVIPRTDSAGQPVLYRLEPFAPTIASGDRGTPPNTPLIPFRFPSGTLTVRVQKPDGSTDTLGPAPFTQSRMRGLAKSNGEPLSIGGGHITDLYQLSTMDSRFSYAFPQDGRYVITLDGSIEDVWGNTWRGGGTYEVHIGRTLSLDTAVLPGTPFEVGDVLNPGVVLSPPVPASVEVRFRMVPNSESSRLSERTVRGVANRFGYFSQAGGIPLNDAGEYRVDVTATYRDDQGNLWMGSRTWGGVIAPRTTSLIAHGRRGIDSGTTIGPQWFFRTQTGIPDFHFPFGFHSGDVSWLQKSDASVALISVQDPLGTFGNLLRQRNLPLTWGPGSFDERRTTGEIPLFSSRPDGIDPHIDPAKVDLWAYSYRSVQRPLVRVREVIGEEAVSGPYWRFEDAYASQIGAGEQGDRTNDIKFQYGAAVLRGSAIGNTAQYAIYGSLFVLIPDNDPGGGSRTFPPFQGNGGGPSGGPIMRLKGRDINLFIHPTAVRPGSVLELGDNFSVAGAVGPPLAANVSVKITKPGGQIVEFSGRANKVGYFYQPTRDFAVDQTGIYTVDLTVGYDGLTSAGQLTQPFPSGDVLGTSNGRFYVYAVARGSALLSANVPQQSTMAAPGALDLIATPPAGFTLRSGHYTATMPGFLLQSGDITPSSGQFSYRYDAQALSADFPNLDTAPPADLVTLTLFGSGTDADGQNADTARIIVLHGSELLNLPVASSSGFAISDRGGISLSTNGTGGNLRQGHARIQPATGSTTPSGLAIFALRQNGALVSEATVPASSPVLSGRIYARVEGRVNTGIAIANPNGQSANISFYFTNSNGENFGAGSTSIAANSQIAYFLDHPTLNGVAPINGTFTFTSSIPVSVIAIRGYTNETNEFLMTTLPVVPLATPASQTVMIPHFADGGGWTTQIVLVNPTDQTLNGNVQLFGQGTSTTAGAPVSITLNGQTATSFPYSIPARSSRLLESQNLAGALQQGSVRIIPSAGNPTPAGQVIFSYHTAGIRVSEAGVPSTPAFLAQRLYVEAAGNFAASDIGSMQSGIAVANPSSSQVTVTFELTTLTGASTGLSGTLNVPANGQAALFLNQIPGFNALALPFQGVLRVSTASTAGVSVIGVRSRWNERRHFLITTTSPVDESAIASTAEMIFPHLADSAGFTMQFILFSGSAGQASAGSLRLYSQTGDSLNLTLR